MTPASNKTRPKRPPAPTRDLTIEELNFLAEQISLNWEISQNTPGIALRGWRGLERRTTRGLWRLWYDLFRSYPQGGAAR